MAALAPGSHFTLLSGQLAKVVGPAAPGKVKVLRVSTGEDLEVPASAIPTKVLHREVVSGVTRLIVSSL